MDLEDTRRIPPPDPDREPLKVNVYERMAKAAAELMPLFPYDSARARSCPAVRCSPGDRTRSTGTSSTGTR